MMEKRISTLEQLVKQKLHQVRKDDEPIITDPEVIGAVQTLYNLASENYGIDQGPFKPRLVEGGDEAVIESMRKTLKEDERASGLQPLLEKAGIL